MNYFTLFPLTGHWGKYAGLAITTISIILLGMAELLGTESLPSIIPHGEEITALLWFFCLGLFFITFSKEKIDDERVQKVRYTSLRALAFFHAIGLFSAFSPLALDANGASNEDTLPLIILLLVFPLIGYQIIFNLGLYLNPSWVYNDLGTEENIRKNPKFFLIYFAVVTLIFVAFILLNK